VFCTGKIAEAEANVAKAADEQAAAEARAYAELNEGYQTLARAAEEVQILREDDGKGSKKSKIEEPRPTPIDKDQTESKPNEAKEDEPKEPRSTPSGRDQKENAETKSNEKDVKEPNEMGRIELDEKRSEKAHLEVELTRTPNTEHGTRNTGWETIRNRK